MSDTREKLIEEKVYLINAINCAMNDWNDYLDECNETCTPPIDKLEDFIADGVFSAGYRKQKWIPVSERLPEEETKVLVYTKHARTETVGTYTKRYGFGMSEGFICSEFMPMHLITHWMPLPEPPKGE